MQSPVGNIIFIFVLFIVFYFFLIRPQKKRMLAQRSLIESIEEGDEIVTMGGILGTVRALEDDEMQLEVAPGTSIRILRSAVARKVIEEDLAGEDEDEEVGDVGEEEERA